MTRRALVCRRRCDISAIIELTATPDVKTSNILVRVSASELKAESMIKLPVILKEHHDGWEECLQAALQRRAYLEDLAAGESPDYVRPILLIRAENKGGVATVDVVRQHLIENELIPEDHIEVATGESPLSASLDLFSPTCPVRIIITKDALKEGWDCSFAYVLCSLGLRTQAPIQRGHNGVLSGRIDGARDGDHDARLVVFAGFDGHALAIGIGNG